MCRHYHAQPTNAAESSYRSHVARGNDKYFLYRLMLQVINVLPSLGFYWLLRLSIELVELEAQVVARPVLAARVVLGLPVIVDRDWWYCAPPVLLLNLRSYYC